MCDVTFPPKLGKIVTILVLIEPTTRKAAKEATSRPSTNKNLFGTLVEGLLFIHFLIESWFDDSLERMPSLVFV